MKCPKCGKEVNDGELFCGNCGYNLAQNNKPSVQTKAQVKKPNNTNKIIIAIVAIVLVVSAVTGGALFVANKKPSYVFGTNKDKDIEILKSSAKDEDYPLYYSYDEYKTFWKHNLKQSKNSKKYDGLSTKKIDSEIADLDLSDYKRKSVDSNIYAYANNVKYFENIFSVKPAENNQKYKRNYYFIDDNLSYAYIYDPDNSDDWYKLYYDDGVLYCYKTPDKTYKYSDITPSKWGCFAYGEANFLHLSDSLNDDEDDYDDDEDYDESEDEDYILPTSDSEYLTRSDVEDLSQEENRLAINEIYARHGYTYQTEDLKEYFEDKSWYHSNPDINQSTWNDSMLNNYERENINLLTTVAKEKGYR